MSRFAADNTSSLRVSFEGAEGRLAEVYAALFTLTLQLRAGREFGDSELLRGRIKGLLDKTRKGAVRSGHAPEDVREAEFALVAFLDETLLSSDWSQKDRWLAKPLQLELFNRYDAGEEFFHRLDGLRANPALHAEVLEVYFLCMALGFKGRYQLHGQEQLRALIEETQSDVARQPGMQATTLAPHGQPRDTVVAEVQSRVPAWVFVVVAIALGFVVYLGMSFYISNTADEVAQDIEFVIQES